MKQKIISAGLSFVLAVSMFTMNIVPALALGEDLASPTPTPEPVEETIAPPADTTGPAFISVITSSALESEVTVVWTTDELAYGHVEYGETTSYGSFTPKSTSATLDHTVAVSGLTPGTIYHYRIVAEDESGNVSYSKDRTFETALEVVAIDNVPPEISEVSVIGMTTSEATITWVTNELAQGNVEYGKTAEYGASSPLTPDYSTEHSASLSGLEPSTEYHYRVVVQDESGNEAVSPDEIFTTSDVVPEASTSPTPEPTPTVSESPTPPPSPTPSSTTTPTPSPSPSTSPTPTPSPAPEFAISQVETSSVTSSAATIIWNTNEPATSQVFYDALDNYASSSAVTTVLTLSHEIKLTGLEAGANYFYKVVSKNVSGDTIEKSGFEFNTLFKQKAAAAAPTISNITVESIGASTATIVFNTDVPAGGKINYGTTTGYEETDGGHNTFLTDHSHPLSGLTPNTTYNFETVVWDVSGNETIYKNLTFTTLPGVAVQKPAPVQTPFPLTPAPSSGGGGGRVFVPPVISKPVITEVSSLDKEILFTWQAAAPETGLKTTIIRSEDGYVTYPYQGTVAYQGNSGRFADINLQNGKKYYYSVYRTDQSGTYSKTLNFTVTPKEGKTQTELIATPPVVQKTPIYKFTKTLSRGDRSKQVEHLQVLLASEASIYQRGLITSYFGSLTENAVKKFQKKYKLPVTGIADTATLNKLEKLSSVEIVNDRATFFDTKLPRDLKVGSFGQDVYVLQQFLINGRGLSRGLGYRLFWTSDKISATEISKAAEYKPG